MPADRPSVPLRTRWVWATPPSCSAFSLPAMLGAGAVEYVTFASTSGCAALKFSIICLVSCRLPAMSRMFRSTGLLGLSGTADGSAAWPPPPPGAPQAASPAARPAASSTRRNRKPVRRCMAAPGSVIMLYVASYIRSDMPVASTSSARRPPPPVSRTDFVRDAIKESILSGEFGPGETLVEGEVGALLGVSKTPVREALRILAGSGLVTMSTYKGAAVRVMDAESAYAVYDLRALLEPEAVRRAVEQGADFSEARQVLAEVETSAAAADRVKASLANRLFHRALYAGCGNPLLVEILDGLRD